jgi:hypothetical protein
MSVEQRLRTDLHAVGQSIHPDPWAALGEVETMATRQQHRTSIALTLAAAVLIAAGVIWGPGILDWITGQPDLAPVDEVEQDDSLPPQEPADDWAQALGVIEPSEPASWSRNGFTLSVDRMFIVDADTFRAVVEAAEQSGESFPMAQPGYADFGTGPVTVNDDLAVYARAETVIGLDYTMTNDTDQPVTWLPAAGMTALQFPGQPGTVGPQADWLPHAGHPVDGVFDQFSGTFHGWALYQTGSDTADQLRAIGELEWRARPASGPDVDYPHGTDDEYPDDWPRLTLTYHY